jgi:glycosyltransferase involved in cell wall biosynthesis
MEEQTEVVKNQGCQVDMAWVEDYGNLPVNVDKCRIPDLQNRKPLLISVLVPTRQRPDMLLRMLTSLFDTADQPERLETVLYIDDDDTATQELKLDKWNIRRLVGPRQAMGRLNAICYAHSFGDIIILGNDDVVVRTRGWDTRIRQEVDRFHDQIYLFYPNDLYKGKKLSVFPILSRTTCDAIGDPFPADYRGAFIDVHIMDIFRQLEGCGHKRVSFLSDVVFEHMHYRLGKSTYDATYRARDRFIDDQTFMILNGVRGWAVRRLRALIENTGSTSEERLKMSKPAGGWFFHLAWDVLRNGSSPLSWRLRLFVWMWLRFIYRNARRTIKKTSPT